MKIKFLALILSFFGNNIYSCSKEPTQEVVLVFVRQSILTGRDTHHQDHITKITRSFDSTKAVFKFMKNFNKLNKCVPTKLGCYSEVPPADALKNISKFLELTRAEDLSISATKTLPYLVYIEQVRAKLE